MKKLFNLKMKTKLKMEVIKILENILKNFFTLHLRPKLSTQVNTWSEELINSPRLGLVVQGPIVKDNDFTLESLKIYQKHFNNTIIILSIWDDEDSIYLERFKDLSVEIILNKKPAYPGYSNINYQILSSYNGIKRAKELGCLYALKTRTDQRIYAPNVKEYLLNLLEVFPVRGDWPQTKRIIGVSLDTYKYRPYGLSDMVIFGQIDDLMLYWGANLDMRPVVGLTENTARAFYQLRVCEMYLVTEYLKKLNRPIKWTTKDSWQAYADHFCVIDQQSIDLYWYKYIRWREHKRLVYDGIKNCQVMTFLDWLNIYQNLANVKNFHEESPELPFDGIINKTIL